MKVAQSCPTLCDSLVYTSGQNTGVRSLSLLQGNLPNPGIEPRSLTLQADSLPAEPQGKPKNTGVGSLSLFQCIFRTQEPNRGLLPCRRILQQLSYQGCPLGEAFLASHSPSGMPVNAAHHPLVLVWKHWDSQSQWGNVVTLFCPDFFLLYYSIFLSEKMTLMWLTRDSYFIKKHLFSITRMNVFYSVRESQVSCFQSTLVW